MRLPPPSGNNANKAETIKRKLFCIINILLKILLYSAKDNDLTDSVLHSAKVRYYNKRTKKVGKKNI